MENKKCSVENKHVIPCEGLLSLVEGKYSDTKKGLFFLDLMSADTGESTRSGYGIKSGQHKKNGVILNYCPWCGEKIGEHF